MNHPTPTSPKVGAGCCANLRHKMMYVMPEPDPNEHQFFDPYDAAAYWCTRTMGAVGPDGRPVHPADCTPGRRCCVD
jgi:hypothetical protein